MKNGALRQWVERQLIHDLLAYGVRGSLTIDWSQASNGSRSQAYMSGRLTNYNRIIVFDEQGELIADGCMDFILTDHYAVCYWDLVTIWRNGQMTCEKKEQGIPPHVWRVLPGSLRSKYFYCRT